MLGCEFTQEEFIDHCTTYGSDYPRMQYTKGGVENEIRFRDSSIMDYHQTVYSVSILLLQDAPEAEAKESEKKDVSNEKTLAAAANISPEQIAVPSSPEAQTYAEAERLLVAGDIAHAAMTFGKITSYKDAWERSSALWREINPGKTIAAGYDFTVAVKVDGTVFQAGGKFDTSNWTNIIAVSGNNHVVGLRADGTVIAVGNNRSGQCDVSNWSNIVAVAAKWGTTLGLKADGTVITVGDTPKNEFNVNGWSDIVAIAFGDGVIGDHAIGLRSNGTVIATGSNRYSECEISNWSNIEAIDAACDQSLGLKRNGTLVTAGRNAMNQLNVSGWENIKAISAATNHTLGLKSNGTVVAAGSNDYERCNVSNWTNIVTIAAGEYHSVGIKADGTAIALGYNGDGQCDVSGWHDLKVPSQEFTFSSTPANIDPSIPDGSFNYNILQNEPGYIYDKFDDYWTWYAAYDEAYSDADLLIGIQLEGEVGGSDLAGATLYTKIRNKENRVIDGVQSMIFLVDGVKYSFPEMPGEDGTMAGSVVLYKNGYELIKAFANAKEVSVKLKLFSGGTVLLDLDSAQFDRTLGNMCRKIIQYKVWDSYIENPGVEMLEMMFPMEITRK